MKGKASFEIDSPTINIVRVYLNNIRNKSGSCSDCYCVSKESGDTVSGTRWTAQIKIGNRQLKTDGTWTKNQSLNEVHIPIEGK
ncbi:hypothetical protein [Paenibacillus brasilensis]|uniref:Uncharacterized protein n=1 Tax=Paenibacillus brasilensis TaxID=128574 RepID=A0ABU0L7A4_9BACL|nr:hypothetical protein [Paenibacillus brasilensis]MDQ0497188.1 hypothetical protein [Paenibacillus brasilensis]